MEYKVEQLLREFKRSRNTLDDIDESELRCILTSPWKMLHNTFEANLPVDVRFRYFGVFKPIKSVHKALVNNTENEESGD